jgi:hypothetical protein
MLQGQLESFHLPANFREASPRSQKLANVFASFLHNRKSLRTCSRAFSTIAKVCERVRELSPQSLKSANVFASFLHNRKSLRTCSRAFSTIAKACEFSRGFSTIAKACEFSRPTSTIEDSLHLYRGVRKKNQKFQTLACHIPGYTTII